MGSLATAGVGTGYLAFCDAQNNMILSS